MVYGSFIGARADMKSQVGESMFHEFLTAKGFDTDFGPPMMKGWKPWRLALVATVKPFISKMDIGILEECKAAFLADILKKVDVSSLHVYPIDVAVNGKDGISYVDSLNMQTSAGFPWRTRKDKFLPLEPIQEDWTPEQIAKRKRFVLPEIVKRVESMEASYKEGVVVQPVFSAALKDEAVSSKKRLSGKTRVFCGAPLDWSILMRKYFMSSVRLIQNNALDFEAAVGVVAQSAEWGKLFDHITKYGKNRIIAGDYKDFDKSMSAALVIAAFEILIEMSRASGNFSEEQLLVMRGIAQDTAFALVDYNGDLISFLSCNPSGHALTVIINGLVNSLYMRVAYVSLGGKAAHFQEDVSLVTYGDDNIASVNEKSKVEFNHTRVQQVFDEIGITYTMADKEAESVPFISIEEASFLKRKWRYEEAVGNYTAPLELESINKMLMMVVKSRSIEADEQMASIVQSAHSEAFFHGREYFDMMTNILKEAVEYHEMGAWFEELPFQTWEQMVEKYHNCTVRVVERKN
jgi:hypothetical protein